MSPLKFSFLFYATAVALGILAKDACNLMAMSLLFVVLLGLLAVGAYSKKNWLFHPVVFYLTGIVFYLLCFILGFLVVHYADWKDNQASYIPNVTDRQLYAVQYRIVEKQKTKGEIMRYVVVIEEVEGKQTGGQALLMSVDSLAQIGDRFTAIGSFQSFPTVGNLGQFDYQAYMKRKHIGKQLKTKTSIYIGSTEGVYAWLMQGRAAFQKKIDQNEQLSSQSKALLSSLLLGNRNQMDEQTVASFQRLGLMHILAISGLHIGVITVFLSKITSFLRTSYRHCILLVLLWIFVFLAGFSPSVFRTVFMFTLLILAQSFKRKQPTKESIGLAFFLSLLFEPYWLFDLGFQLSYLAVLSIVWLMPLFKKGYTQSNIVNYFLGIVYVSLIAQLCVLPLQLYYFNSFSWTFLGSNLVVIPLITVVLVGGFCFLSMGWMSTSIAEFLGWMLEQVIQFTFTVLQGLNEINLSVISFYLTKEAMMAMCMVGVGIGVVLYKPRIKQMAYLGIVAIVVQISCFRFADQKANKDEFIIAAIHGKEPLFLHYTQQQLQVFGEVEQTKGVVEGYSKHYVPKEVAKKPRQHLFQVDANHKLLVLSKEMPYYQFQLHFELIYLSEPIQVNIDRVLALHQPQMVIIGRAMSFWYRDKVIQSCLKRNIPFHDMREKGYWSSQFL
ncbi:ComEC/Rec2 family competence protein [Myroides odoratus]|uniref:ComEC/Rec2 family competence protein n=1 Tax=Myroides odoratus TaxID=256 RepID=UPI00334201C6